MKFLAPFSPLLVLPVIALAAVSSPGSKIQEGQRVTGTLLATARVAGKAVPDGMRFLVLVARKSEVTGEFTLKETRDFLVAGESYQEKTQAELGKKFEPGTMFDTAESFFTKQPGMRNLAPPDIKDAYILSISIGGAKLSTGAKGEITLHVGFDKQVEPLTFRFAVPPDRPPPPNP
jgi:hypothetical protein